MSRRSRPPTRVRGRRWRGGRRRTAGVYRTLVVEQNFDLATGAVSDDSKYVANVFLHQMGRYDENEFMNTSNVISYTGITALRHIVSMAPALKNMRMTYRRATLVGINYKIEWKGRIERQTDTATEPNGLQTEQKIVGGVETLYMFRGHESLYTMQADANSTGAALAPSHMLGWDVLPYIPWAHYLMPDQINSSAALTKLPDRNWVMLKTVPGLKALHFTPEKNVKFVKWKPVSRADKIYRTWNLDRLNYATGSGGSAFDDDQRCGGVAFYRNLLDVSGYAAGDDLLQTSNSIFQITAYCRFRLSGWVNNDEA